jgi:hypothetical protein
VASRVRKMDTGYDDHVASLDDVISVDQPVQTVFIGNVAADDYHGLRLTLADQFTHLFLL